MAYRDEIQALNPVFWIEGQLGLVNSGSGSPFVLNRLYGEESLSGSLIAGEAGSINVIGTVRELLSVPEATQTTSPNVSGSASAYSLIANSATDPLSPSPGSNFGVLGINGLRYLFTGEVTSASRNVQDSISPGPESGAGEMIMGGGTFSGISIGASDNKSTGAPTDQPKRNSIYLIGFSGTSNSSNPTLGIVTSIATGDFADPADRPAQSANGVFSASIEGYYPGIVSLGTGYVQSGSYTFGYTMEYRNRTSTGRSFNTIDNSSTFGSYQILFTTGASSVGGEEGIVIGIFDDIPHVWWNQGSSTRVFNTKGPNDSVFRFKNGEKYQFVATYDSAEDVHRIYINGKLITERNAFFFPPFSTPTPNNFIMGELVDNNAISDIDIEGTYFPVLGKYQHFFYVPGAISKTQVRTLWDETTFVT